MPQQADVGQGVDLRLDTFLVINMVSRDLSDGEVIVKSMIG
jgi:hypothetical protein